MHDLLLFLAADTPSAPAPWTPSGDTVAQIVLALLTVAALFGGLRNSTKSLADAAKKHAQDDEAEFKAANRRLADLEKQNGAQEVTLGKNSEAHTALSNNHAALAGEIRNRTATIEQRLNIVEQGTIETRAELRALSSTVARIDKNVDEIHKDIVQALLPKAQARRRKP